MGLEKIVSFIKTITVFIQTENEKSAGLTYDLKSVLSSDVDASLLISTSCKRKEKKFKNDSSKSRFLVYVIKVG